MPDITMCNRESCPKKESCYRYKATPSQFQSYSNFNLTCTPGTDYSMYWDMNPTKEVKCMGCGKDSNEIKKFVSFNVPTINGDYKAYLCKECIEASYAAVNGSNDY